MVEDYYVIMVWSEYVLYKVMVIVSIFMYVWIFYKVSDKCRIMWFRVIWGWFGVKDLFSDWYVMYVIFVFFVMVLFLGFIVIDVDYDGYFCSVLIGMIDESDYKFED